MDLKDLIPILAGILLVVLEIIYDRRKEKAGKPDKPISTILRGLVILGYASWIMVFQGWREALLSSGLLVTTFFLLFDQALNAVRWARLPLPYSYRKRHNLPMGPRQEFLYSVRCFLSRFFWHGDEKTISIYDKAFHKIPWPMELLIKGTLFYIAAYYYF